MKKQKRLIIEITDPEVIRAFEDIARVRNIREETSDIKLNWTARDVAAVWLKKIANGVIRSEQITWEYIRQYPTHDWEDVDKLRIERSRVP